MLLKKLMVYILASVLLLSVVNALAVGGSKMSIDIMFEPNAKYEYRYRFTNNDGWTADYDIWPEIHRGHNLEPYFTIEPSEFDAIQAGESREFNIVLQLPEEIDTPGESETRVWIRGLPDTSGGMTAAPVVGIRFKVFVLFPYPYVEWSLSAPSMNVNETREIIVNVQNLGEPVLRKVYADIEVFNAEDNSSIAKLKTNSASLNPKEKATLKTTFSSAGRTPGDYYAKATLHYAENTSVIQKPFKIGTMIVHIRDFTKEFEKEAINKMNIKIESGWNSPIENVYAKIKVFNGSVEREFKSLNSNLRAWETQNLEAYFDTKGLGVGNYSADVAVFYDDGRNSESGTVQILEKASTQTVEKMPSRFNIGILTSPVLLIGILIFFLIINLFLVFSRKKKESKINPKTIRQIREAAKTISPEKLRSALKDKGWSEEEIEEILDKI